RPRFSGGGSPSAHRTSDAMVGACRSDDHSEQPADRAQPTSRAGAGRLEEAGCIRTSRRFEAVVLNRREQREQRAFLLAFLCSLRFLMFNLIVEPTMLHVLIMAGGGGTRFWPRSRKSRPKQFLTMAGDRTLLQSTYDRVEAQVPPERAWVITSSAHRDE